MKRFFTFLLLLQIFKISDAQEWFIELPYEGESTSFYTGAMSGDYNYSFGAVSNHSISFNRPLALCADNNAEYIHKDFDFGYNSVSICSAVGLGDGDVFVLANYRNEFDTNIIEKLWMAVLNPELEIVYQNFITSTEPYKSFGNSNLAILNENDEIVVVAQITEDCTGPVVRHDYAFYKIDKQCNIMYSAYLENNSHGNVIDDIIQMPGTDIYTIFGRGMYPLGGQTVIYVDDDFNLLSYTPLDNMNYYPYMINPVYINAHWLNEDSFIMSFIRPKNNDYGGWYPLVFKMDTEMNILDSISFEREDTTDYVSEFGNMVYHNPNTIYVSSFWNHGNVYSANDINIYLINEELELLGEVLLENSNYVYLTSIQAADNEGCIVNGFIDDGYCRVAASWKFNKNDFVDNTSITEKDIMIKVKAYPNPVMSCLNFEIDEIADGNVFIEIVDINGKKLSVHEVPVSNNQASIDLTYLNNGIYCYRIFTDNRYVCSDTFLKK